MTDIDCIGDADATVDRESRTVTIELTPGGSADCAFANTPDDGGGPPDEGPPDATPPGGTLPDTGAPAGPIPAALLGLLLVAAGAVAVRRSRG